MITLKEFNWLIKHFEMDEETCKIYSDGIYYNAEDLIIKDKEKTIMILSDCDNTSDEPLRELYFKRNDDVHSIFIDKLDNFLGKPNEELLELLESLKKEENAE